MKNYKMKCKIFTPDNYCSPDINSVLKKINSNHIINLFG